MPYAEGTALLLSVIEVIQLIPYAWSLHGYGCSVKIHLQLYLVPHIYQANILLIIITAMCELLVSPDCPHIFHCEEYTLSEQT